MARWKDDPINSLGPRFNQHIAKDEGLKNVENVFAVSQHSVKHAVVHGIMLRQPLPALQNVRRDVDILAQFLQRVPAKKKAVEECCFLLRLGELKLRSLHILRIPFTILTRKISDAPVKFLLQALSGNTIINPLSSPRQCSCGLGDTRTAVQPPEWGGRGVAPYAQLQIPSHPAKINSWP